MHDIPLIKIAGVCKSYKNHPALKNVNLEMARGDILAFLGPNGAGKTTTVNILTGLLRADAGEVYYEGRLFDSENLPQKRIMGVVPQHNNLDRDLTVTQNLKIHGFLFGLRGSTLEQRIEETLEQVDMTAFRHKPAGKLSGGQKRRLVIARALLHNPKILFLDEPSAGLDVDARRKLHQIIAELNMNAGVSVFLTTHYIEEADLLAAGVAFIDDGEIVAKGKPAALKAAIGQYAMEYLDTEGFRTLYFDDRDKAVATAATYGGRVQIREVTLEDVYLKVTGKSFEARHV